jgi:hypothetical protein
MTTHPLSGAQMVPMTRQKGMIALSLLVLCTLGLSLSARAEKSALTTFDPPGSIETIPNSINRSRDITLTAIFFTASCALATAPSQPSIFRGRPLPSGQASTWKGRSRDITLKGIWWDTASCARTTAP